MVLALLRCHYFIPYHYFDPIVTQHNKIAQRNRLPLAFPGLASVGGPRGAAAQEHPKLMHI